MDAERDLLVRQWQHWQRFWPIYLLLSGVLAAGAALAGMMPSGGPMAMGAMLGVILFASEVFRMRHRVSLAVVLQAAALIGGTLWISSKDLASLLYSAAAMLLVVAILHGGWGRRLVR